MSKDTIHEMKTAEIPLWIPIRCSVCGKQLLNLYPNTLPGTVFATCCNGHKTSYRIGEASRKAV